MLLIRTYLEQVKACIKLFNNYQCFFDSHEFSVYLLILFFPSLEEDSQNRRFLEAKCLFPPSLAETSFLQLKKK